MKINQLDLFSGIGGFHLGFEKAGYKVNSYFSEIDKHAIAVYKHKFKNSKYVGSVTDVRGEDLPKIDLITFGSPCQDFSLAGKRKGMGGNRSSLVLEAIRLIRECRPRVFVWENVKGTFSSNSGEDFAAILQAFTNIGGYRLEWQLLNTANYLPQNRERIYLVGYSTKTKRNWRGVFPVAESTGKNNELSRHHQRANTITTRYAGWGSGSFIGECEQSTQEIGQPMIWDDYNQKMRIDGNVGTLTSNCGSPSERNGLKVVEPMIAAQRGRYQEGKSNTLTAVQKDNMVLEPNYRIRRLTPIECERLQGFPDNHTEFGDYDGEVKKMSNNQRYKQCGNAVTVDVVEAVALRCKALFKGRGEQ